MERHLASGLLVQALDDWSPLFHGHFLYYPNRRPNLPAFKITVDALRHRDRYRSDGVLCESVSLG
ncbi:type 2 periplasmic-binding domain-containing protein [Novosphingobium lindaniclasticum]|uniref:LysR substrate-binding domain-containing protein n=1 Tax=Novosphingobium lindaniclasticum LE124 TaxID=1096930 RepID=T0J1V5_9SPHN|nr:hypothetical protein [Novosphingobium lindaniclasticum]EQB15914.1 hypothetical protein L284_10930 [Novosphingobium lindaniclasticum LE124]